MSKKSDNCWVLVEDKTQTPLTIEGGAMTIGPFFFTTKKIGETQIKALTSDILAVKVSLSKISKDTLVHSIYESFDGVRTDMFSIDASNFPLTEAGAKHLDKVHEDSFWADLFAKGTLRQGVSFWMSAVLAGTSELLGVNIELDNLQDEVAETVSTASWEMVNSKVSIRVVPETVAVRANVWGSNATFWVRTVGMHKLNRPELEFRGVPALYAEEAVDQLTWWAANCLDNPFQEGQILVDRKPFLTYIRVIRSTEASWGERLAFTLTPEQVEIESDIAEQELANQLN